MRRKLIALILLGVLLAALCPAGALAEGEVVMQLPVGTVDGAVGNEVTVPISISDCATVDSLQFNLNYDSTALALKLTEPGQVFPGEYVVVNGDETNRLRVACISALGLDKDGVMLNVTFSVLREGGSAITITDAVATSVDATYAQSKAYIVATEGGVTTGGGALAAPVVTPWIAETPEPTPSPEPTPAPEATAQVIADETDDPGEATPEPALNLLDRKNIITILIAVIAVLVLAAVAIVIISVRKNQKRRRRKNAKRRMRTKGNE